MNTTIQIGLKYHIWIDSTVIVLHMICVIDSMAPLWKGKQLIYSIQISDGQMSIRIWIRIQTTSRAVNWDSWVQGRLVGPSPLQRTIKQNVICIFWPLNYKNASLWSLEWMQFGQIRIWNWMLQMCPPLILSRSTQLSLTWCNLILEWNQVSSIFCHTLNLSLYCQKNGKK